MKINEIISEATAVYSNPFSPEEDFGLMTLNDFLWYRNTRGKSHPDYAYDTSLENLNRPDRIRSYDISDMPRFGRRTEEKIIVDVYNRGMIIRRNQTPVAVYSDNIFYYTLEFPSDILPINYLDRYQERLVIQPSSVKKVKYINSYVEKVLDISGKNLENYPAVMRRFKLDGEDFIVKTKTMPYVRNSGNTLVVINRDNFIVAVASDEWGSTLLRVAREYRNRGLGKYLGTIWYKNNPSFESGGFSPSGKANAAGIWAGRVRELLQSGAYSELVRQGAISKEKVNQILADLPRSKPYKKTDKYIESHKPELLLYTDNESMFVLYDKKFFQEPDEKYVYAHGFLRSANGKIYIFTLDYDNDYRKMAALIIFQIAHNISEKLYVASPPSDHLEISDIPEIAVDSDQYAGLVKSLIDLRPLAAREKLYRQQHDKYDEKYHQLLELANSKWS